MRASHENRHYLPGFEAPSSVTFVSDPGALLPAGMWVVAVPASAVRGVMPLVQGEAPIVVVASKGLEHPAKLLTDVASEVCPSCLPGVLSGPNLAVEIARQIPTGAVSAFKDPDAAETVKIAFMCPSYRVFTSDDVVGVELAGALKNVLAIGAGMSDGLGYGDNSKGALMARGLMQMADLGLKMGARIETFMDIAGVGDLFATASSRLSRNYRCGLLIAQGRTLSEALAEIGQIVEGVYTAQSALELGRQFGASLPIFEVIESVLHGRVSPVDAVGKLMGPRGPS